jgi:hypothetical protein
MRHVRIRNQIILYELKEPYVASGASILGALEYDQATDRVKCHECGEWFENLARHISGKHQIPIIEYKRTHGLRRRTCLWNEKMRTEAAARMESRGAAMIKLRQAPFVRPTQPKGVIKHEQRNVRSMCHAQVLDRMQKLGQELRRTPTNEELYAVGLNSGNLRRMFSCTMRELILLAGLEPRKRAKVLTKAELLAVLHGFYLKHGRAPYLTDHRREMLPSRNTYIKYFGSWAAARELAGITKRAA